MGSEWLLRGQEEWIIYFTKIPSILYYIPYNNGLAYNKVPIYQDSKALA